jgi:hypothetical protein
VSAGWQTKLDLNDKSCSIDDDVSNALYPLYSTTKNEEDTTKHRPIINHSLTCATVESNNIANEVMQDTSVMNGISARISDGFQSDFYYLCPMTNTTSFSTIDQQKKVVPEI